MVADPVLVVASGVVAAAGFGAATLLVARGTARPGRRLRRLVAAVDRPPMARGDARERARRWFVGLRPARSLWAAGLAVASVALRSIVPLVVGVAAVGWSVVIRRVRRRRAEEAFRVALPDVVESVAASLRSGAVPVDGLRDAAAAAPRVVRDELDHVVRRVDRGERLGEALAWWADHHRSPQLDVVAAVVSSGATFGGPLARALDDVASFLRDDLRARDEVRAQVAQATASATMLVALPVVSVAISAAVDPSVITFLTTTPLGAACVLAGSVLDAVGGLWMLALVRGAR